MFFLEFTIDDYGRQTDEGRGPNHVWTKIDLRNAAPTPRYL
jgi:hypothetical protein